MSRALSRRSFLGSAGLAGALGLAGAAGLTGCVQRESEKPVARPDRVAPAALTDVVLRVGDQKGGTEALLRASGQLTGTPYRIEFSTFTSGPPQVEALDAGRIDFALTGNTPPIFGAASGARLRLVSRFGNAGRGEQILVPGDSPVRSVADLRGRRVAVGKGTSAHGHLLLQLRRAGLTVDEVHPVFLQPAEGRSAFRRGDVDAWAVWDPYTAMAERDTSFRVRTLATAAEVADGAWFGLAAVDALEDAGRSSAIADLSVRLAHAGTWASRNVDRWAPAYAAEAGVPLEAALLSESRSARVPEPLADGIAGEQALTDAFISSGDLKGPIDIRNFVDDRYTADLAPVVVASTPAAPAHR